MTISSFKNEDAIDLLADILEPTAKILADKELAQAVAKKANKITAVKIALKNHKSEVIEILARLEGKEVEEYSCNIITLTMSLLELLNDKELSDFFTSQSKMMAQESSSSVMENTEEGAQ